jgi:DNA-binding IclR family transcriptional regulator
MANKSDDRQPSSFGKGLELLGWILDHGGARAETLSTALDIPLSTTYRLLRTLRGTGFVSDHRGEYVPGPRLTGRTAAWSLSRIAAVAAPFLAHLSTATGETALLAVRQGLHAVCASQVESGHQIRLAFRIGQLLPLSAGASQRAILAFSPEQVQRAILDSDLRSFTPHTPSRAELPRLLARTRADGLATSRGELTPGSVSLAAPVLRDGVAVGSLCVAGPQNRCGPVWQGQARAEVVAAARSMSELLGDSEPGPD